MGDRFISTAELAEMLGLKSQTLRRWRSVGHGPTFVRFGDPRRGRVRYAQNAVDSWLVERTDCTRPAQTSPGGEVW